MSGDPVRLSLLMQDVAAGVHGALEVAAGEAVPLVLVVQCDGVAQYVSNCDRKDGADLLRSLLARWDAGRADIPAHYNPDLPRKG